MTSDSECPPSGRHCRLHANCHPSAARASPRIRSQELADPELPQPARGARGHLPPPPQRGELPQRGPTRSAAPARKAGARAWACGCSGEYEAAAARARGLRRPTTWPRSRAPTRCSPPDGRRRPQPIFERLSKAYPDEPRPRGGRIEARFEADLDRRRRGARAREPRRRPSSRAPAGFAESAEGRYLRGRAAELRARLGGAPSTTTRRPRAESTRRTAGSSSASRTSPSARASTRRRSRPTRRWCSSCRSTEACSSTWACSTRTSGRDDDAAACYDTIVKRFPADAPRAPVPRRRARRR